MRFNNAMTNSSTEFFLETATSEAAAELAALAEHTFRQAFTELNTVANMEAFCAASYGTAPQRAELVDPMMHTLLARANGAAIGFCQLREGGCPEELPLLPTIELKRLYVESAWHSRGVAHALMAAALAASRARGAQAIWLSAWTKNPRALKFYQKFGFEKRGERVFMVGDDPQRDWLLWRVL